ncbi:hypothetical protein [Chamaesiphon sp. OTE_75_metabat_556]|jgi:hypothetical protein|uniref:hypothetical protein n=1 Tax=Chamaesiphon sp. OTE_75_metabat_556 TaxID=2964692 RepID=UPI00286A52B4|nr:hypothetical protein [Chamaesiphon sp. OTE_75_metabat_556]
MAKFKPKLLLLLLPATASMGYFTLVSGSDANIFAKEMMIMVPLQVLAFVYVWYANRK